MSRGERLGICRAATHSTRNGECFSCDFCSCLTPGNENATCDKKMPSLLRGMHEFIERNIPPQIANIVFDKRMEDCIL